MAGYKLRCNSLQNCSGQIKLREVLLSQVDEWQHPSNNKLLILFSGLNKRLQFDVTWSGLQNGDLRAAAIPSSCELYERKHWQMAIKQYDFSECLQFIVEVGGRNFGSISQHVSNVLTCDKKRSTN